MEKAPQKTTIIGHLKENYRLYAIAFGIVIIAELIGTIQFSVGSALIVLYPMLFAIIISILFGKDVLGFLKKRRKPKKSITARSCCYLPIHGKNRRYGRI